MLIAFLVDLYIKFADLSNLPEPDRLFQTEKILQTTILDIMKMAENSPKG